MKAVDEPFPPRCDGERFRFAGMIRLVLAAAVMVTLAAADVARLDALAAEAKPKSDHAEIYPWETVIGDLRRQAQKFFETLKSVRVILVRRAEKEDPSVIGRLYLKRPIRAGYGVLPEIVKELPERSVAPRKTEFSLQALAARTQRDVSALARLDRRA